MGNLCGVQVTLQGACLAAHAPPGRTTQIQAALMFGERPITEVLGGFMSGDIGPATTPIVLPLPDYSASHPHYPKVRY